MVLTHFHILTWTPLTILPFPQILNMVQFTAFQREITTSLTPFFLSSNTWLMAASTENTAYISTALILQVAVFLAFN